MLCREIEFDDGYASSLEVRQEPDFVGLEEQQTAAFGVGATSSTTNTVNIVAGIVRRVELDNEVDGGDLYHNILACTQTTSFQHFTYIETSCSNIGTNQNAMLSIAEFEKGIGSLLLLLLAVKIQNRAVNVVEEF